MRKKILSIALVLMMCMGLLPVSALELGTCGDMATWELKDSGQLVISGRGDMEDYQKDADIPWRQLRLNITSIRVESGITHIGENAFSNCIQVARVELPDTLTSIGNGAFSNCGVQQGDLSIVLPNSLTSTGSGFSGCNMRSLTIPSSVTKIESYAFNYCSNLREVTIPDSVRSIADNAFSGCLSLTKVTLPKGITDIGANAFRLLPSQAVINYPGTQAQWDSIADGTGMTTQKLLFDPIAGSSAPTVRCLVEDTAPSVPVSLNFADQAGSDGIVEVSADHPSLSATLTAPVGSKLTCWTIRLYTQDGQYIAAVDDERRGTIAQVPSTLSFTVWKAPSGGKLTFSDFSLTLGETYRYELSVTLDGTVYTTGLGQFRLGPAPKTYTVSFCNPVNMTYSPEIQVTNGQKYGRLPTPSMPGKVFDGWYTADNVKITSATTVDLTRDQTLYAHWTQEQTIALKHVNTPGSSGVVELSVQNDELKASLSAPKGTQITQWAFSIYTLDGSYVGRATKTVNGYTTGDDYSFGLVLWMTGSTPVAGQVLDYNDFKLSVGTVYQYEFTAQVEGATYSSGRAKFCLSVPGSTVPPAIEVEQIPASGTAYASTQTVTVDGKKVIFQMYALKGANGYGTNYIKLRDLAYVLNGTKAQFSVDYDGTISLTAGQSYTVTGAEMSTPFSGDRTYAGGTQTVKVGGKGVDMTAITLLDANGGGYNYFKLRDLGKALGFYVGYSNETGIYIQTDKPYSE